MKNKIFLTITYTALVVLLSGCSIFRTYKDISEKPIEGGLDVKPKVSVSSIEPVLKVPVKLFDKTANNLASNIQPIIGNGREVVGRIYIKHIIDEYIHGIYKYDGGLYDQIKFRGGDDYIYFNLPLYLNGQVGLSGDLAKLFSLNKKNFNAKLNIDTKSKLNVDENYCIKPESTSIAYEWKEGPQFELMGESCIRIFGIKKCIGPWRLNLEKYIDKDLKEEKERAENAINQTVLCSPIRDNLTKVWANYSSPVDIPYLGKRYLNISPEALSIPRLRTDAENYVVSGKLESKVAIQEEPLPNVKLELPVNKPYTGMPGKFHIILPVESKYYTLNALITQELVGKVIVSDTPLGQAKLTPKKVYLYPSNDKIVIGLSFLLGTEKWLFDTSGTVWLMGSLKSSEDGKKILISNLKVTRKFTNPIWNVASVLLQDKVTEVISKGFELDLSKQIAEVEMQVRNELAKFGNNSKVDLLIKDVNISIGDIVTAKDLLHVEGVFDATIEANLNEI